jgi:hypothetical protein
MAQSLERLNQHSITGTFQTIFDSVPRQSLYIHASPLVQGQNLNSLQIPLEVLVTGIDTIKGNPLSNPSYMFDALRGFERGYW